jgi:hypothetical protein
VNHTLWTTDPAEAGNQCANQIVEWVDPWTTIGPCARMSDVDDILIFLGMRDKTNALNPSLTSGMLLKMLFQKNNNF